MIDYDALAVSLVALFLALIVVLIVAEIGRRRRRKIIADPPLDENVQWMRAWAESDGDHRAYVDYRRGN